MTFAEAKNRLNIVALWHRLGLHGTPSRNCRSPFRDEKNASFWISPDWQHWEDYGDGSRGDAIDFLQRALDVNKRDACFLFLRMAGGISFELPKVSRSKSERQSESKSGPTLPHLRGGAPGELAALAKVRGLSISGVQLCQSRGLLRFGRYAGEPAWFVLDASKANAQARRLDGEKWSSIGKKAWTLKGSQASHPIGISETEPYEAIWLVEGAPDLLAACALLDLDRLAETVAPVAMLGAALSIPKNAIRHFCGKRVAIFPHQDIEGLRAAYRWREQLCTVAGSVEIKNLGMEPDADLNDYATARLLRAANAETEDHLP